VLLGVYIGVLVVIGYLAFYDQDFNNPENSIGRYMQQIADLPPYDAHLSIDTTTITKEELGKLHQAMFDARTEKESMITQMMEQANDTANGLQELAVQAFNIMLGALLAFLSGTATLFFQAKKKT